MAESLETYAEDYHEVRAEAAAIGEWTTGWVKQVDPPADGRDSVYLLLDVDPDLMVLRVSTEYLLDLVVAYPALTTFLQADTQPTTTDLTIRAAVNTDTGHTQIADVGGNDAFYAAEPDAIVTEVGHDPEKLEAMYRDTLLQATYTKAMDTHGRPPRVELDAMATDDDALCVQTAVTVGNATGGGVEETIQWAYATPANAESDAPTRTLIDILGGGDPRFIDGESAYLLPLSDCAERDRIQSNHTGEWGLVPPALYDQWQTSSGLLKRLRSAFTRK